MHTLRPFTVLYVLLAFNFLICTPAQAQEKEDTNVTFIFVDHEDKPFNVGWMEPKFPGYQYGPNNPQKGELPLEHTMWCMPWHTEERYDRRWEYHPETNFCMPKIFGKGLPKQMLTEDGNYIVEAPPNEEGIVTQMNITVPPGEHTIRFRRSIEGYKVSRYAVRPEKVTTYIIGQNEWTLSGDTSQTIFVRLMDEHQMPTVTNATETIGAFLLRPVGEWDGTMTTVEVAGKFDPLFGGSNAYRPGDHVITHRPNQHILPGEYILLWSSYWAKWDFGSCLVVYTSPDVSDGELDIILASKANLCYAYDTLIVEKKNGVVTTRTEQRGQEDPPKDVFFSVGGEIVSLGQRVVIEPDSNIQIFGPSCWYHHHERGWTRDENCPTRYE